MKVCPQCDEAKPIEAFGYTPRRGKLYPHAHCKACRASRELVRVRAKREEKAWQETVYLAKRNPCFGCPKRNGCVEECWDYRKYLAVG